MVPRVPTSRSIDRACRISGAFAPGAASAATLTTLHAFTLAEGAAPRGRLVQGTDGNFYGITSENGANGRGTVYRITPGGSFTVLHSFANPDPSVGTLGSALVQGFDGYFYGVSTLGTGSVFKISSSGNYVLLHQFQGVPDGVFLGDLVPGASVAIPLTFPITAGVSGAAAALRWNLNSGSGTSSGAVRLTLP